MAGVSRHDRVTNIIAMVVYRCTRMVDHIYRLVVEPQIIERLADDDGGARLRPIGGVS